MDYFTAKKEGYYLYDPPVPCKNGHIGQRYVNNNSCVLCNRSRVLGYLIYGKIQAIELKQYTYYTGRSCIHGHYAERYVISGRCIKCANKRKPPKPYKINLPIIDRKMARDLGLKTYYTGKICKNRHNAERYVFNGHCAQCDDLRMYKRKQQCSRSWEEIEESIRCRS